MSVPYSESKSAVRFPLWQKLRQKNIPIFFDIELTRRCNNDCKHCYINLPAGDVATHNRELSIEEIDSIASQAVEMGALYCLVTGGEPLLRPDFSEIYLLLKNKGLLLTVFTNACLVTEEHIQLFQKYPPHELEVSVYGATQETYERITRKTGSYRAFLRGLNMLIDGGIKVQLKAMIIRSNIQEFSEISHFCREFTSDSYRFDPLLHLRYDGNPIRNAEIISERLTASEISKVEQLDPERFSKLQRDCDLLIAERSVEEDPKKIFYCGSGLSQFSISYDGRFRLCSALNLPQTTVDLRKVSLSDAYNSLPQKVRATESEDQDYLTHCATCELVNLCLWCPAHAYLEVGRMDGRSEYFCQVAHARALLIQGLNRLYVQILKRKQLLIFGPLTNYF